VPGRLPSQPDLSDRVHNRRHQLAGVQRGGQVVWGGEHDVSACRTCSEALGALNLYSCDSVFSAEDEDLGAVFAAQAAIVLANAQAYWDARDLSEQLSEAMPYRAVIEQAKGILMSAGS
jgi:hypothetical protein